MKKFAICYAFDLNYFKPFLVSLNSLLKNKKNSDFYDIYCLVPSFINKENFLTTKKFNELYENFNITQIELNEDFSGAHSYIKHITNVTYYRLKISSLIPNYDKCLYLDVDTIITGDITPLLTTNLSGYHAAGVKHSSFFFRNEIRSEKHVYTVDAGHYINAGVILFNLSSIRENKLEKELIQKIDEKFEVNDQDILNLIFYKKIKFIHLKYNFLTKLMAKSEQKLAKKVYAQHELESAVKSPLIIHYASTEKPWDFSSLPFGELWDESYNELNFPKEDLEKRRNFNLIKSKRYLLWLLNNKIIGLNIKPKYFYIYLLFVKIFGYKIEKEKIHFYLFFIRIKTLHLKKQKSNS